MKSASAREFLTMPTEIIIHSDGACSGNPGPGGWSACVDVRQGEMQTRILLRGGSPITTNNAMELSGAANGLAYALTRPEADGACIRLRSDSEYVLKGLRDWAPGWAKRGWRTASGDPVKNRDLWERLLELKGETEGMGRLELEYVRGHSGDPGNEAADAAAVAARDLSRTRTGSWSEPPVVTGADTAPDQPDIGAESESFRTEGEGRGYRRYLDPFHQKKPSYLFSMQLRVKDDQDTLYFLSVDAWDMGRLSRVQISRLSLEANAQFHTEDDNQGNHVNISTPFRGFEETEVFFGQMWSSMRFGRYERSEPAPAVGA